MRVRGAQPVEDFARLSVQEQEGRTRLFGRDLDILPGETAAPACAEGLEGGLLGGEARGVVLRRLRGAALAVEALAFGEDALAQARRARDGFTHALDFDNVYADGNDHG